MKLNDYIETHYHRLCDRYGADLVGELFLKQLEVENPEGYISKVARTRIQETILEPIDRPDVDKLNLWEDLEEHRHILTGGEWALLKLRVKHDYSTYFIADETGIPERELRRIWTTATNKLRKALKGNP